MLRNLLFIPLLLCCMACQPTYQKIKSFEQCQAIETTGLLVFLPKEFKDYPRKIELFEKYGQMKKVDRYSLAYEQQVVWIKSAFREEYSFSKVYFAFDSIPNNLALDSLHQIHFQTKSFFNDRKDRTEQAMCLLLQPAQKRTPQTPNVSRQLCSRVRGYELSAYRYLIRKMNKELFRLNEQRQHLSNHTNSQKNY